jgi:hypothetical protein
MQIREHRGFTIQVYESGAGYVSEIYRKGKLIHTVYNENDPGNQSCNPALIIEAAREWIDRTYPQGRIKYFGEV